MPSQDDYIFSAIVTLLYAVPTLVTFRCCYILLAYFGGWNCYGRVSECVGLCLQPLYYCCCPRRARRREYASGQARDSHGHRRPRAFRLTPPSSRRRRRSSVTGAPTHAPATANGVVRKSTRRLTVFATIWLTPISVGVLVYIWMPLHSNKLPIFIFLAVCWVLAQFSRDMLALSRVFMTFKNSAYRYSKKLITALALFFSLPPICVLVLVFLLVFSQNARRNTADDDASVIMIVAVLSNLLSTGMFTFMFGSRLHQMVVTQASPISVLLASPRDSGIRKQLVAVSPHLIGAKRDDRPLFQRAASAPLKGDTDANTSLLGSDTSSGSSLTGAQTGLSLPTPVPLHAIGDSANGNDVVSSRRSERTPSALRAKDVKLEAFQRKMVRAITKMTVLSSLQMIPAALYTLVLVFCLMFHNFTIFTYYWFFTLSFDAMLSAVCLYFTFKIAEPTYAKRCARCDLCCAKLCEYLTRRSIAHKMTVHLEGLDHAVDATSHHYSAFDS